MAFNIVEEFGDAIATSKDNEFVCVQMAEISSSRATMHRIEARVFYTNDEGELRPTKAAVSLNDVDEVDALIKALTEAKKSFAKVTAIRPTAKRAPTKKAPKVRKGVAKKSSATKRTKSA